MRPWLFLVAASLLTLGSVLAWQSRDRGVGSEPLPLRNEAGPTLQAMLYLPTDAAPGLPGVLLCHGIDSSKEHLEPLAVAFAQRGFVAVTFDLGGHGESYPRRLSPSADVADAGRALAALADRPEVDRHRLGVVGFSMGAPAAVDVARKQAGVQAVVAIGRAAIPPGPPPRNLLLAGGFFDQFQKPVAFLGALRTASGQAEGTAGELYGSFQEGTARRLVLSPDTDHSLEPFDSQLMGETVHWVEEALGLDRNTLPHPRTSLRPAARSALFSGCLLLLLAMAHGALGRFPPPWLCSPVFRRAVAGTGVALCLAPVPLSRCLPANHLLSDAGVLAVLLLLGVDWLLCRHAERDRPWAETPAAVLCPILSMVGLTALAWLLGLLLHRAGALAWAPSNLLGLPGLVAGMVGSYPYLLLSKLRVLLFQTYSTRLLPAPAWYGCLLVELALPGEMLTTACGLLEALWRRCQHWPGSARKGVALPRKTMWLRLGLVVGLLVLLTRSALRWRQLSGPVNHALALEFSIFLVLVAVLLLVLIRLTGAAQQLRLRRQGQQTAEEKALATAANLPRLVG